MVDLGFFRLRMLAASAAEPHARDPALVDGDRRQPVITVTGR
ncbi:hypothetical protein AB0J28_09230 [Streptosporangium canum]